MTNPSTILPDNEQLRLMARLAGVRPKKGLGQNFLVERDSLTQIAAAANIKSTETILEIGPGLGFLTLALCAQAQRVVAVEADPALVEFLHQTAPANLDIVSADILNFNLSQLPPGYKVVANIPYYLTAKLLRYLIEHPNPPSVLSLLVQREVAERIVASAGRLSVLALSVQYYAYAKIEGVVERHKFWPAPKVDSAILVITRRPQPVFAADPAKLFRLIKAGFGERRKQLKNSLAGGLNADSSVIAAVLQQANINPTKRAQELALPDWERLYRASDRRQLL